MDFALPVSLFTLPDNAVLLCVFDNIRHVNVWRCHPILEAGVVRSVELEGEFVTLVLICQTRNDNDGYRTIRAAEGVHLS